MTFSSPAFKADDTFLKARDKLLFADHEALALGGTAFEGFAIDLADEIHRHEVTFGGGTTLFGIVGGVALGEIGERLVDRGIVHIGDETFELQGCQIPKRNRRQNLERHVVGEIALAAGDPLERIFVEIDEFDLRLLGRALVAILDGLCARIVERLLHHFLHHRLAVDLLEVRQRNLAAPKPLDLHAVLEFIEARTETLAKLRLTDHHLQGALQSVSCRFRDLHRPCPDWRSERPGPHRPTI